MGDIVALPSETVYGLAGLALDKNAVRKIFALKGRPATNPLIVHVANVEQAEKICEINELAKSAASTFWPGPLTLVLPKKPVVPDLVTAENDTVAIRVPKHPIFLEVLNRLNQPLAAPSANPSNRTSPTEASHLPVLFGENCPPTVDGGKSEVGLESTVLDLSTNQPTILRPGVLTRKELENKLGQGIEIHREEKCATNQNQTSPGDRAPGMHPIHYAPTTPLHLYSSMEEFFISPNFSPSDLVFVTNKKDLRTLQEKGINARALADNDCGTTIAQNLYRNLIDADKLELSNLHLIFALESSGVNRAIIDRLRRAATSK